MMLLIVCSLKKKWAVVLVFEICNPSSIVYLSKRKEKDGTEIIGNIIHCKNYKSRLTKENKVVDVRLTYDKGLDRHYGLLDLALKHNIFKQYQQE